MSMSRAHVLELLACLSLSEPLFREVTPPREVKDDKIMSMWFAAISDYYETWGEMPSKDSLASVLTTELQSFEYDEQIALGTELKSALSLMKSLASKPADEIERVGRHRYRQWSTEMLAKRTAKRLEINPDGARAIFDEASQAAVLIDAVESGRFKKMFGGTLFGERKLEIQPTGLDFIDMFLGGGTINGEVTGHLAPSGGGKTTLVMQLAWTRAERQLIKHLGRQISDIPWETIPRIYIFAYEIVVNLIVNHMSNAASIPRTTAMQCLANHDQSILSTSTKREYKDYEQKLWGDLIDKAARGQAPWPPGELERLQRIAAITDQIIEVVPFSGERQELLDWSSAGVKGIRQYIETHQLNTHKPGVDMVFVDYVGAMVDAMDNIRKDEAQALIKKAPLELSRTVANRFDCPVWASHQLNSGQNKLKGGTIPDPLSADRCHMYHEQCSVCLASGVRTKEDVAVYRLAKHRRDKPVNLQIARLDGLFARWVNASKDYELCGGQILRTGEVNKSPEGRVKVRVPTTGGFSDRGSTGLEG